VFFFFFSSSGKKKAFFHLHNLTPIHTQTALKQKPQQHNVKCNVRKHLAVKKVNRWINSQDRSSPFSRWVREEMTILLPMESETKTTNLMLLNLHRPTYLWVNLFLNVSNDAKSVRGWVETANWSDCKQVGRRPFALFHRRELKSSPMSRYGADHRLKKGHDHTARWAKLTSSHSMQPLKQCWVSVDESMLNTLKYDVRKWCWWFSITLAPSVNIEIMFRFQPQINRVGY